MAAQVSRRLLGVAAALVLLAPAALAQDDEGLPNVFISPAGKPFRAPHGAPYPVVDWFRQADKNSDGKLDHAEFIADAAAFFKELDLNNSGLLDPYDVAMYEHRTAPEIIGGRVRVGDLGPRAGQAARLWLAQYDDVPVTDGSGDSDQPKKPQTLDETLQGASPYSLLPIPEPITAGGLDARGVVTKAAYMAQAERNFSALDEDDRGYLTLDSLPLTKVQELLGGKKRRRR
ncbi:hypothetical protein ACO2Q3_15145 [Caulobacter sp. KR2-114]|uniref:hypothetical protein n=1 Tax=Caulobacter sp. KR2-114 TaxID=3400912 RepID=UPI003BFE4D5B